MPYVPPHLRRAAAAATGGGGSVSAGGGAAAAAAAAAAPRRCGCDAALKPHTLRAAFPDNPRNLLGGARGACCLLHVKALPEARPPIEMHCVAAAQGQAACSGKTVTALARLRDADGRNVYVARYTSCKDAEHAEEWLLQDARLREAVGRCSAPATLTLMLSESPCHYSSNRASWSCTEALLKFEREALRPKGVQLDVAAGIPYRAHWDERLTPPEEWARVREKVASARQGLGLLSGQLRAMSASDWAFVGTCCSDQIQAGLDAGSGGGVPADVLAARRRADAFTAEFFAAALTEG